MTVKCLCHSCTNNCSSYAKSEFAMQNGLTYIYLKNGTKIANSCNHYKALKSIQNISIASIAKLGKVQALPKYL